MVWAIRRDAWGRTARRAQRPCALSPSVVRLREKDAPRIQMCGLSAVGRDPRAGIVRDRATGRRLRGGCLSARRVPGSWPAACDERDVEILFAVGLVNAAREPHHARPAPEGQRATLVPHDAALAARPSAHAPSSASARSPALSKRRALSATVREEVRLWRGERSVLSGCEPSAVTTRCENENGRCQTEPISWVCRAHSGPLPPLRGGKRAGSELIQLS